MNQGSQGGLAALRVLVSGLVQGVWFRQSTADRAHEAGVSGWVRNLPDGRVEAHLQGEQDAVDAVVAWMRGGGPPGARVDALGIEPTADDASLAGFQVRR